MCLSLSMNYYSETQACPTVLKIQSWTIFAAPEKIVQLLLAVRIWTVLHAQKELGAHIWKRFRFRIIFSKKKFRKKSRFFWRKKSWKNARILQIATLSEKNPDFSVFFRLQNDDFFLEFQKNPPMNRHISCAMPNISSNGSILIAPTRTAQSLPIFLVSELMI